MLEMTESRLSVGLDGVAASCEAEVDRVGDVELPSSNRIFEEDVSMAELDETMILGVGRGAGCLSSVVSLLAVCLSPRFLLLTVFLFLPMLNKREDAGVMIQRRICLWYSVVQRVCCPRVVW